MVNTYVLHVNHGPCAHSFYHSHHILVKPDLIIYNGGSCNGSEDELDQIRHRPQSDPMLFDIYFTFLYFQEAFFNYSSRHFSFFNSNKYDNANCNNNEQKGKDERERAKDVRGHERWPHLSVFAVSEVSQSNQTK